MDIDLWVDCSFTLIKDKAVFYNVNSPFTFLSHTDNAERAENIQAVK